MSGAPGGVLDSPIDRSAGRSGRGERKWGLIGGLVGSTAGVGAFVVARFVQGEKLSDLSGSPYPPVLERRELMPLDFYFLAVLLVGAAFLGWALFLIRRGSHPRTDGYGAGLTGAILSLLGGVVLFVRLSAVLHG